MLCSKCSERVRPIVALDIDGTLGDYHSHFLKFAAAFLGVPEQYDYDGSLRMREWFCGAFGVDLRTFRDIKLAYRQGGMKRTMPVYSWAQQMVRSLHTQAEVWLTTTRPWQRFDRIDPDTHAWLARHEIPFDGMLYDDDKYARLAERVDPSRVCAVLDDEPDQVDRAQEVFGGTTALLRVQRYNCAVRRTIMAAGLDEAHVMITAHIDRWEKQHDDQGH
jgi:hypothetical protein